jgi:DNA-binding NarL/FixJ family response regulator
MPLNVFIVEDHALMRETLREFIQADMDCSVCGAAARGEDALAQLEHMSTQVVIVDVLLPSMSGIEMVEILHSKRPEIVCIMLSGHSEASYVRRALDAGALGYVLKGNPTEIPEAIRQASNGIVYLSGAVRERLEQSAR